MARADKAVSDNLSVHVAVVAPGLADYAERYRCSTRDLCTALLVTVFSSDLVDGILDGDQPEYVVSEAAHHQMKVDARGAARRLVGKGRTVFNWLCAQAGPDDEASLRHSDLAAALQMDLSTVHYVLMKLRRRGLIEQVSRGVRATPSRYRLLKREVA